MSEQWRSVLGYEGLYEVSNLGHVVSVKFNKRKRLNPKPTSRGYKRITLRKDRKRKGVFVHEMVLEAFVSQRPDGLVANHKNGDKSDNRVQNLEWITQKQNVHHAIRKGNFFTPRGEQCGPSKLTEKQVLKIRSLFATGNFTKTALAARFDVTDVLVGKIVRHEIWRHI